MDLLDRAWWRCIADGCRRCRQTVPAIDSTDHGHSESSGCEDVRVACY